MKRKEEHIIHTHAKWIIAISMNRAWSANIKIEWLSKISVRIEWWLAMIFVKFINESSLFSWLLFRVGEQAASFSSEGNIHANGMLVFVPKGLIWNLRAVYKVFLGFFMKLPMKTYFLRFAFAFMPVISIRIVLACHLSVCDLQLLASTTWKSIISKFNIDYSHIHNYSIPEVRIKLNSNTCIYERLFIPKHSPYSQICLMKLFRFSFFKW